MAGQSRGGLALEAQSTVLLAFRASQAILSSGIAFPSRIRARKNTLPAVNRSIRKLRSPCALLMRADCDGQNLRSRTHGRREGRFFARVSCDSKPSESKSCVVCGARFKHVILTIGTAAFDFANLFANRDHRFAESDRAQLSTRSRSVQSLACRAQATTSSVHGSRSLAGAWPRLQRRCPKRSFDAANDR